MSRLPENYSYASRLLAINGDSLTQIVQPTIWRQIMSWVVTNNFLLALVIVNSFLLLSRLDNTVFWIDESMNAMLGQNILRFGYPVVWNGSYLVEPYFNAELTNGLVRISHTWLQFYLTALSLAVFGSNTFAARLPFVICGILSVVAIYFLARRISRDERIAKLSALLLCFHTGFLLYSRTARYFSLTFLTMILMALTYLRWSGNPNKKNLALFTLCSVLLFYTHFPIWPFLIFTIGIHFLVYGRHGEPGMNKLAQFTISSAIMLLLVLPWIIYAHPFRHNIYDWSGSGYFLRLLIFTWKINGWVFPFFTLLAILGALMLVGRLGLIKARNSLKLRSEYLLLLCIPLYVFVIILAPHPMISSQYTAPAIPFAMILTAFLLMRVRDYNRWIAAVTLALLLSTNVLNAFPYIVVEKLGIPTAAAERLIVNPTAQFNVGTPLAHYLSEQLVLESHFFEYCSFIRHPYQHRLKAIAEYLKVNGRAGQTVLAPWHDADAVKFYTDLNVVYHFKPSFTIESVKALVYKPGLMPDWVIPNAYYEPNQPFFKYRMEDYERVYISSPKDYIYENEPNLDFFMWRTNMNAPQEFFLLKRKEFPAVAAHDAELQKASAQPVPQVR